MAPPDAETLRHLYEEQGMTLREIAALAQCRVARVLAAMQVAGIVRRRSGRKRAALPNTYSHALQEVNRLAGRRQAHQLAKRLGMNREKCDALLGSRPANRGNIRQQTVFPHDVAVRAAYDSGTPVTVLANQYRCSRRAISRSLDRTIPIPPHSQPPEPMGT